MHKPPMTRPMNGALFKLLYACLVTAFVPSSDDVAYCQEKTAKSVSML